MISIIEIKCSNTPTTWNFQILQKLMCMALCVAKITHLCHGKNCFRYMQVCCSKIFILLLLFVIIVYFIYYLRSVCNFAVLHIIWMNQNKRMSDCVSKTDKCQLNLPSVDSYWNIYRISKGKQKKAYNCGIPWRQHDGLSMNNSMVYMICQKGGF